MGRRRKFESTGLGNVALEFICSRQLLLLWFRFLKAGPNINIINIWTQQTSRMLFYFQLRRFVDNNNCYNVLIRYNSRNYGCMNIDEFINKALISWDPYREQGIAGASLAFFTIWFWIGLAIFSKTNHIVQRKPQAHMLVSFIRIFILIISVTKKRIFCEVNSIFIFLSMTFCFYFYL